MSDASDPSQSRVGRGIFIVGLCLQASVLFGLMGTVRGMRHALEILGSDGISDQTLLGAAINEVLASSVIALLGNIIGMLLMFFALWLYRLRERWMYLWSLAISILFFPLGLPLLVFCLVKRREFAKAEAKYI